MTTKLVRPIQVLVPVRELVITEIKAIISNYIGYKKKAQLYYVLRNMSTPPSTFELAIAFYPKETETHDLNNGTKRREPNRHGLDRMRSLLNDLRYWGCNKSEVPFALKQKASKESLVELCDLEKYLIKDEQLEAQEDGIGVKRKVNKSKLKKLAQLGKNLEHQNDREIEQDHLKALRNRKKRIVSQ